MRIGLLAYATDTGLGRQTFEFQKQMRPEKTLVVDLSALNKVEVHLARYDIAKHLRVTKASHTVSNLISEEDIQWLTDDVDVLFVCETPLNYRLFEVAKSKGVATVLQYNSEFLDYFQNAELPAPTVLAAPSWWMKPKVKALNIAPVIDWPVPVNEGQIPFRKITSATTFVHVVGRAAVHDRNGTMSFLMAAGRLKDRHPGLKYKLYIQSLGEEYAWLMQNINNIKSEIDLEVFEDVPDHQDMYAMGDVLVMPRKFGGLCLPMQEALSAGMPVIMTDIEPNRQWLPKEWLVPAFKKTEFEARTTIEVFEADDLCLADKMAQFATTQGFMEWSNLEAKRLGEALSWKNMVSLYDELLEMTCRQ